MFIFIEAIVTAALFDVLEKNDLYNLSQKFIAIVLDLINEKGFFPYDYEDRVLKSWCFIIDLCVWNFYKIIQKFFEFDLAHCLSSLGYSWDAMLKFTDVNSKLISGVENYQYIESTIKSGISTICKSYAEANNKFLILYYNDNNPRSIMYLDAINLYRHSMLQIRPTETLDWVNPKDFNLDNCSYRSIIGCFLEVDLGYPNKLCDLHNGYPLVNEKVKGTEEILSEYQSQITENDNFSLDQNKKTGNKINV